MPLIPYEPSRAFENMRKEMDRFLDFPNWGQWGLWQTNAMQTDVYETDTEVIVECAIPGLEKKDDIQIDLDGQQLRIHASIEKQNTHQNNARFHQEERYYGHFDRSITLPHSVEQENINANYRNGILKMRMQKTHPADKSKIDVDFQ